jgi:hypothetical protein
MKMVCSTSRLFLSSWFVLFTGCGLARGQQPVPLPQSIAVRMLRGASPTIRYAGERIASELRTIHGVRVSLEPEQQKLFAEGAGIVLVEPGQAEVVLAWCRQQKIEEQGPPPAACGYRVVSVSDPLRVVVMGSDAVGAWYGACAWLDALVDSPDGSIRSPLAVQSGSPALAIRFARSIRTQGRVTDVADVIPSLDWWARWRVNTVWTEDLPQPVMNAHLAEAHKRGIRVLLGLGVRNLCASDDQAVARCTAAFERFLQNGGDGVSMLWDDLPHSRCAGHCDRCRERFGPQSLPREIVHILEAFCEVAARQPQQPLIAWCPSHYSRARYPEMSDEDFFRVIGASARVREYTHMYFCEFPAVEVTVLDRCGITQRIWWYNGMRGVYSICNRWPASPQTRLSIPDFKGFPETEFVPFDQGWKTGIDVRPDGTLVRPSAGTWRELHTLATRYAGYYPCTPKQPYHVAVGGSFAFAPDRFRQEEADRVVFRAIFGPGAAAAARNWSDLYSELQVRLARNTGLRLADSERSDLQRVIARWALARRDLEDCASRGQTLLPRKMLDEMLSGMSEAEKVVVDLLARR